MDTKLNKALWATGVRNVPKRIRVRLSRKRNDDEEVSCAQCYEVVYTRPHAHHGGTRQCGACSRRRWPRRWRQHDGQSETGLEGRRRRDAEARAGEIWWRLCCDGRAWAGGGGLRTHGGRLSGRSSSHDSNLGEWNGRAATALATTSATSHRRHNQHPFTTDGTTRCGLIPLLVHWHTLTTPRLSSHLTSSHTSPRLRRSFTLSSSTCRLLRSRSLRRRLSRTWAMTSRHHACFDKLVRLRGDICIFS